MFKDKTLNHFAFFFIVGAENVILVDFRGFYRPKIANDRFVFLNDFKVIYSIKMVRLGVN